VIEIVNKVNSVEILHLWYGKYFEMGL
jgi:hypothetical protein